MGVGVGGGGVGGGIGGGLTAPTNGNILYEVK